LDAIPDPENAILISNHVYFGDFFLVHHVGRLKGMLSYCRYFLKDSIKFLPVFGWGMYLINMPFLKRDWQRDNRRIRQALDPIISSRLPIWFISFVEGHRMSPEKLRSSQAYAKNTLGAPRLNHVLLPRSKGLALTLGAFRESQSHITALYDLTLAYNHRQRGPGAVPSLYEIVTGALDGYEMHIHVQRHALNEIPFEDAQITSWLYDVFSKKDALLAEIKGAYTNRNLLSTS
jgi:lysophosphatidic acid acyltransferase/lysophosphatidylinositol acyltransferase